MILTRFAGPNWEQDQDQAAFLPAVDRDFHSGSEQHPMRRWEYSLALQAWDAYWREVRGETYQEFRARIPGLGPDVRKHVLVLDVGGAGSPLMLMVAHATPGINAAVVDPKINYAIENRPWTTPAQQADAVFCVSTLEHVDDPYDFLEACVRQLMPGGLLFLTVDAWDPPDENQKDTAHFHWMRKRIFTRNTINHVMDTLSTWNLRPLGEIDLEYKGNTVYGYTFASICMKKEP